MMKQPLQIPPVVRSFVFLRSVAFLAALALGLTSPARADLTIQVLDATATAGGVGNFDVILKNDGGAVNVGGFSIELSVAPGSGVTFTGANTNTSPEAYLFGTYQSAPFPFATDPSNPGNAALFPNTDFAAGDVFLSGPGFVTVGPTDVVGLAHISFAVAAGATGPVTVSLVAGGNTSLSDVNGASIPAGLENGTITLTAVPEPSALALGAFGAIASLACARRRLLARLVDRS